MLPGELVMIAVPLAAHQGEGDGFGAALSQIQTSSLKDAGPWLCTSPADAKTA